MKRHSFWSILIAITIFFGCKPAHVKEPRDSKVKKNWLWTASWHPSENLIATGGTGDTLKLFRPADRQAAFAKADSLTSADITVSVPGTITKLRWHPEKELLAVAMQGGKIRSHLFDLSSKKRIMLDSAHNFGARGIGWNNDGSLLAVGDYDGRLRIYQDDGLLIRIVDTAQKAFTALDWHPEKNILVAVGDDIVLYDYELDNQRTISDREEEVLMLCARWHPSGEFFVTADYGDTELNDPPLLQFWGTDGELLKTIDEGQAAYRNLEWSPDGRSLATASDKLRLWSATGRLKMEREVDQLLWGVSWSPDGQYLITTDGHGNITLWDKRLHTLFNY